MRIPIISRFEPRITSRQRAQIESSTERIRRDQPQVNGGSDLFRELAPTGPLEDAPTLHLDDFSEIPVIGEHDTALIVQQRARLRAADGDWIAQTQQIEKGYSDYCEYRLGLGRVTWLYPGVKPDMPRQMALQCWRDRRVRHDLIRAVRRQGMRYIHPYLSTLHVWELAALLGNATRCPVRVIGPPPALARWANDKIEFTRAAASLLGPAQVPRTEVAYNFAKLAQLVHELGKTDARLGIKFPFGIGGSGNFLLDTRQIRGLPLAQLREQLQQLLSGNRWPASGRLLIDVWETDVISSPSVQSWIPPRGTGAPVIEGIFEQIITGLEGAFTGTCTLPLPREIEQEIVDSSFQLALLLQNLGYVGRCSFDLILVGQRIEDCRIEFIECNARWGGTSLPMTLVNRIFAHQPSPAWCSQKIQMPAGRSYTFLEIVRQLDPDLFDAATGAGRWILFNPGRIQTDSALEAIATGGTPAEARHELDHVLPARLRQIASPRPPVRPATPVNSGPDRLDNGNILNH